MNLTNLFRDQAHVDLEQSPLTLATYVPISSRTVKMNSNAVVNQDYGFAYSNYLVTTVSNVSYWEGAGLLMSVPVVDDTPYRVKARVNVYRGNAYAFCGYSPASPTGSADTITKVVSYPIASAVAVESAAGEFDEVIKIPGLSEGDTEFGKPIAFGIAFASAAAGANCAFNISVQNMAKTVPQFAASMS